MILFKQCGGTVKVSHSIHPAVISTPPAPTTTISSTIEGSGGRPSTVQGKNRPDDWDCVNPDCENRCYGFRVKCNRCGTGKDGTPPPAAGGGQANAGVAPVSAPVSAHRPRLQLG